MSKANGVPRADGIGFRYRRTKESYTGNAEQDNLIGEEFENIAALVGDALGRIASSASSQGVSGASGGPIGADTDTDQLVAISELDDYPDFLKYKLTAGRGIDILIGPWHRTGGLLMRIQTKEPETIWRKYDFNTWVDSDGVTLSRYLFDDGTGERKPNPHSHTLIINHPINHPHYIYHCYRPLETHTQTSTTDYHPVDGVLSGKTRGRYQITHEVLEQDAGILVLRFHQPEYGTVLIGGPSTI